MLGDDELLDQLGVALHVEAPASPPPERIVRLRQMVAASSVADHDRQPSPRTRQWSRGTSVVLAAAMVVAVVVATRWTTDDRADVAVGVLEFEHEFVTIDDAPVTVEGRRVDVGRVITITSTGLPILPGGSFYEVWFVGPDDEPGSPDRISAGTFHPDSRGNTSASFTAAVDPEKYPTLTITSELGDGDPAPSAIEVLRGELVVIDPAS